MRGLLRHQRLGMAGAIEQQIGAEIFRDIVGDGLDAIVDLGDAVGKARQRHRQGIDGLALRIPFRRDGLGNFAGGRNDVASGRRADRLAVERDGKTTLRLGDTGRGIKSLALGNARRAPHRLLRIERRLSGDFIE